MDRGLDQNCLRPFNLDSPPQPPPNGVWSVDWANCHLGKWREMVTSTIEEMTSEWKERILMSSFEVGASFLDGTLKVDFNSMPTHLHLGKRSVRRHMTKLFCKSVNRWAGTYDGHFTVFNIPFYRLDHIVEFTVRFTCTKFVHQVTSTEDSSRPFETRLRRRELGVWNCFACLSGFKNVYNDSKPQAKRFIVKEVRRNSC